MGAMAWRILVISDLGRDSGEPVPVTAATLDAVMSGLVPALKLPTGATMPTPTLAAFEPAAVAAALGAGASAAAIDAALHAPEVQRIEASWRGLSRLLSHVAEPVRVELLSLPRASLVERFREAVHARELTAPEPVSLVVLDADFTHKSADLAALGALASMAAEIQAPIVANAGAGFFDLRFLVQLASVKDVAGKLADAAHAGWQAFQKSEDARWVCLTLNRFLLRAPWTTSAHTESCAESNPDSYLWGRGGWLVAAAVARSVAANGHALDLSGTGGRFDDVATRAFPVGANDAKALATEVPFPETQSLELTHAAFTPLAGGLDRPSVMMSMVVTAHRYGTGRLTVEGTLAYQLTAARVALACGEAAATAAGDATQAAAVIREQLGALLGEAPDALAVQVIEAAGTLPRRMSVTVKPPIVLETKHPVFAMEFAID